MSNVANLPITSRVVDPGATTKPPIVCVHGGGCNADYFDLPGFSFSNLAAARGYPLLLVNRPGHGDGTATAMDFGSTAKAILAHVHGALEARSWTPEFFMLGHSIGAAIVMIAAGELRPKGLQGIALSGIGDTPTAPALMWARKLDVEQPDLGLASELLFGPAGSFSWRAPKALRHAAERWHSAEVDETIRCWPDRFSKSAAGISVPVHLRLAEGERIWETGPEAIGRLAATFANAPEIDADISPDGGHLYEVHLRGNELMASQLDFMDLLATRLDLRRSAEISEYP